jgi:hypothetical protein
MGDNWQLPAARFERVFCKVYLDFSSSFFLDFFCVLVDRDALVFSFQMTEKVESLESELSHLKVEKDQLLAHLRSEKERGDKLESGQTESQQRVEHYQERMQHYEECMREYQRRVHDCETQVGGRGVFAEQDL